MSVSEKPLISIIVPCYNAAKYIEDCLLSVSGQTYENWECLLIDDGSQDSTLTFLQKFSQEDDRYLVFSQENQGLSATRNFGIANAKGDYIFFLDSDDLLTKKSIASLINKLDTKNDIITGITVTVTGEDLEKSSQLQHPKQPDYTFGNINQEVLIYTMETGLTPVAQNRLYRKKFLEEFGLRFKNKIYHEDELWFFETMLRARDVKFINSETYLYRTDNTESITKNLGVKNLNSYLEILETVFDQYYKNNHNSYQKAIISRYLSYLKKLIIDFSIREKSKLDNISVTNLEQVLKKVSVPPDGQHQLSANNEDYYHALNKLSLLPFDKIEKYFFKNPVNSIRKRYKLFQIKHLLT